MSLKGHQQICRSFSCEDSTHQQQQQQKSNNCSTSSVPREVKRRNSSGDSILFDSEIGGEDRNLIEKMQQKWKKIWKRDFAEITPLDPSYKGIYLGNVVTTWAKGEGCLERPASALWKNHTQGRSSIKMKITVSASGLKAQTREHGLTEYYSNRLTFCGVSNDYPKLFCWVYRHEGRKLKQELRCHAVLVSKNEKAQFLAQTLRHRLSEALFDFKKEKILRQNARLSLIQSLYSNNGTARRRIQMINTNSQNYKPPLERSRSAPKLSCIEENEEEEDIEEDEEIEETILPTSPSSSRPSVPSNKVPVNDQALNAISEEDSFLDDDLHSDLDETSPNNHHHNSNNNESPLVSRTPGTPPLHRRSLPSPQQGGRESNFGGKRPKSLPLDRGLNLPYLSGYDKVMHHLLKDIPQERPESVETEQDQDDHVIDDEGYSCISISEPITASSSQNSSGSDSDHELEGEEEDFASVCQKEEETKEDLEEINDNIDNVSDESGYSEERLQASRLLSKLNSESLQLLEKNKTKSQQVQKQTNIITSCHQQQSAIAAENVNHISSPLVIYDNLCFEI